ncbi:cholecystokinin receptor type A-like isoform X2 [Artemia franciscana]|uniref:cholecystokinin receptor type A-like isoform X2 n=1 Tax=Artemia franciscana TaxID=6661 RepID=UPI0032DB3B25
MKAMGNKSFNNATSGEDLGLEIVIPLYSTIFMLAVIGNTLVIVTLSRNRRMRTVTNIFLLNLAIADLLLGVFCMPFTLVGQALQNFIFGQLMCNLIPFFQASAVSSSVWTLVAISLERYFAICKPLRSRSWQTKSHAYKSIVAIWFGSFLFCLPIGLLAELQPISETGRHKCREVWPSLLAEKSYNLLLIVLFLVLPLILMGFAYSLIVYQLKLAMKLTITEPICEADIKIRVNSCENSRSFSENKNMEHKICARNLTQNTDCASATSITKEMRCLDHIRSCPSYCCPKSQNPFLNARNSLSESPPTKKSQVENNFRGSVRKSYSDRNITAKKKEKFTSVAAQVHKVHQRFEASNLFMMKAMQESFHQYLRYLA